MRRGKVIVWWAGVAALVTSLVVLVPRLDVDSIARALRSAADDPAALAAAVAAYAAAFAVRGEVWRRVLPSLPRGQAWAALHVSLGGNHILPLRLGEALRVVSVVRRTQVSLPEATASSVTLRAADVIAVVALAMVLSPRFAGDMTGAGPAFVVAGVLAAGVAGMLWLRRLAAAGASSVRVPTLTVLAGATAAWVLESAVVWQSAQWAGLDVTFGDAVLVTAVTIAAQILAVAPGGIGTYELAATVAFAALGAPPRAALTAAVTAHAVKTLYAVATGAAALVWPAPAFFGRLRLQHAAARPATTSAAARDAAVVLFMPAHNEEETVGALVRRAPATVSGRAVRVVVIDDGSADATAAVADEAGAEVVRLVPNRGLGAAVRTGLAEGVARGAAAVAFCDADGEYAPDELDRIVAPILEGRADYVVGSRFDGDIRRMLPQRRFGNRVLTVLLRFVARAPISDGQSGYRALSAAAAADAEVIHDFNYAQVLTLDLLAKGYRYAEVPISYGFREHGRSFVRLGRYLRAVLPAVHREVNRTHAGAN
ncbi:MAG: glycosyltransferase [Nitriliruptorales bacterium]|nr:glycosyltransferase [Nitriliruptorales bacterium]